MRSAISNATEMFIMAAVFKNVFFYGQTKISSTTGLLGRDRNKSSMSWAEFLLLWYDISASLLTIVPHLNPMYIFGKKYRSFWHRHNVLKMLQLETDQSGAMAGLLTRVLVLYLV
jgi:hypothetical protein